MGIEVRAGCVHLEAMRAEKQRDGIILPDCGRHRLMKEEREQGTLKNRNKGTGIQVRVKTKDNGREWMGFEDS